MLRFLDHTQLDTHKNTYIHTGPVGRLWMSDQPVAEAATYATQNKHNRRTSMPSMGFEPAIPVIKGLAGVAFSSGCIVFYYRMLIHLNLILRRHSTLLGRALDIKTVYCATHTHTHAHTHIQSWKIHKIYSCYYNEPRNYAVYRSQCLIAISKLPCTTS
jgi:hypothetical protein